MTEEEIIKGIKTRDVEKKGELMKEEMSARLKESSLEGKCASDLVFGVFECQRSSLLQLGLYTSTAWRRCSPTNLETSHKPDSHSST